MEFHIVQMEVKRKKIVVCVMNYKGSVHYMVLNLLRTSSLPNQQSISFEDILNVIYFLLVWIHLCCAIIISKFQIQKRLLAIKRF